MSKTMLNEFKCFFVAIGSHAEQSSLSACAESL